MDYLYFLRNRTRFLRGFYDEASAPFVERKRKIKVHEPPFDPEPTYEESEPPFLVQWMEADEALEVLGHMCISPLASSLQLFVREWLTHRTTGSETAIKKDPTLKAAFKQGWIHGYRVLFRDYLRIDWAMGPSDLQILEEIVLARNASQHPDSITTLHVKQTKQHAAQYPRSFFADEFELLAWSERHDPSGEPFWPIRLNVTREKLLAAVDEVERFCDWLDAQEPQFASKAGHGAVATERE